MRHPIKTLCLSEIKIQLGILYFIWQPYRGPTSTGYVTLDRMPFLSDLCSLQYSRDKLLPSWSCRGD